MGRTSPTESFNTGLSIREARRRKTVTVERALVSPTRLRRTCAKTTDAAAARRPEPSIRAVSARLPSNDDAVRVEVSALRESARSSSGNLSNGRRERVAAVHALHGEPGDDATLERAYHEHTDPGPAG